MLNKLNVLVLGIYNSYMTKIFSPAKAMLLPI